MSGMEKRLLPVCVSLLVAAGALLPWGAASLQDRALAAQTDVRVLDGVHLTLQNAGDLPQLLSLLATGPTRQKIGLLEGGGLTEQEAMDAAVETVGLLTQKGLLPEIAWDEPVSTAHYMVFANNTASFAVDMGASIIAPASGEADSAVIWECQLRGGGYVCVVRIDGASGIMASILFQPEPASKQSPAGSKEALMRSAWRWSDFLRLYYGFDSASVRESSLGEGDGAYPAYTLQFTWAAENDEVYTCLLPLKLREGGVDFNW